MKAFFKKPEDLKGDFGEVELKPEGLWIRPPASMVKKWALGFLAKGKPFTLPYERIKNLRIVQVRPGLVGKEEPFVEIEFLDENNQIQTCTLAPTEGTIKIKYKGLEFYEELKSKITK